MLMVCFKDVGLCLHVGLMRQCLTGLCVSVLISLIKDKSVRSRQTFLGARFKQPEKHSLLATAVLHKTQQNSLLQLKQKIKKFPPLPQFSIITPKHSQRPNQPRESPRHKSCSCCSGVTTVSPFSRFAARIPANNNR